MKVYISNASHLVNLWNVNWTVRKIRQATGISLKESRAVFDRINDGERVELEIINSAEELLGNPDLFVFSEEGEPVAEMNALFEEILVFLVKNKVFDSGLELMKAYKEFL